jgi:hypothetical protein
METRSRRGANRLVASSGLTSVPVQMTASDGTGGAEAHIRHHCSHQGHRNHLRIEPGIEFTCEVWRLTGSAP